MITDLYNGLILSEIPHNCFPTGVGRGKDVLNLSVPRHNTDVFSRLKQKREAVRVTTKEPGSMPKESRVSNANEC